MTLWDDQVTTNDNTERLRQLRARIVAQAPDPAANEWEEAALDRRNLRQAATGRALPPVSELIVRVFGAGVRENRLSVKIGTEILGELQAAVEGVGSAIAAAKEAKPPGGLRRATQFDFTPSVAPGSLVFFLERRDEDAITGLPQESFADIAAGRLVELLVVANADDPERLTHVIDTMRALGPKTASHLVKLTERLVAAEVSLDLGQLTRAGHRRRSRLDQRGCSVIREAAERNQERSQLSSAMGRLNTVSDGSDMIRLTLADKTPLRLSVTPETGLGLGAWLGREVEVHFETTVRWQLASGREVVTHRLLRAELAPPRDGPLPGF